MYVIIYTDAYLHMHFYTYKYWHKYVNMVMGQYQCENLCPISTHLPLFVAIQFKNWMKRKLEKETNAFGALLCRL